MVWPPITLRSHHGYLSRAAGHTVHPHLPSPVEPRAGAYQPYPGRPNGQIGAKPDRTGGCDMRAQATFVAELFDVGA